MNDTIRKARHVATLLALAAGAATAQAPEPDEDAAQPAPVYDIELIVFEYRDGLRGRPEDFAYADTGRAAVQAEREALLSAPIGPLGGPAPGAGDAVADGERDAAAGMPPEQEPADAADAPADAPRPLEFRPLPADQLRLGEVIRRMRVNGGFDTLVHTAWRQPVYGPDEETTLDLARVAGLPARLGGAASLYVTRFLHLTLDLDLAHVAAPAPGTDTLIYHLSERRKMRSAELHFFDHPRFGALALISPVETESEDGAPADAGRAESGPAR